MKHSKNVTLTTWQHAAILFRLLTPLFSEAGVTSWSHETDFFEPCPSAIESLKVTNPPKSHSTILKELAVGYISTIKASNKTFWFGDSRTCCSYSAAPVLFVSPKVPEALWICTLIEAELSPRSQKNSQKFLKSLKNLKAYSHKK